MRTNTSLFVSLLLCLTFLFTENINAQNLTVEGKADIKERIDVGKNDNTFVGRNAGLNAQASSNGNTFIGQAAGLNDTIGIGNVFVGESSGVNSNANDNTFLGRTSGLLNTSGFRNTFLGKSAGADNLTGFENVFVGLNAGEQNSTGTRNTFLGTFASPFTTDSLDRAIAIGFNAKVNCSNCAVIGGIGDDAVSVGIGTNEPDARYRLNVVSSDPVFDGIQVENIAGGDTDMRLISQQGDYAWYASGSTNFFGLYDNKAAEIRMLVDSVGDIALGSFFPEAKLHLMGDLRVDNGQFQSLSSMVFQPDIDTTGNDSVSFLDNTGTPTMTIKTNGDLEVSRGSAESALTRTLILLGARNAEFQSFSRIDFNNFDDDGNATNYTGARIASFNATGNDTGDLRFFTNNGTSSPIQRMRINGIGNIGISTTNPQTKLHIENGIDANLTGGGYLTLGNVNGTNMVLDDNEIHVRADGNTSNLFIQNEGGNTLINQNGDGTVAINVSSPDGSKVLHTSGGVRMENLPLFSSGTNLIITSQGDIAREFGSVSANAAKIETLEQENQHLQIQIAQLEAENKALNNRLASLEQMMQDLAAIPSTEPHIQTTLTSASLEQNAPNPFHETTSIHYFIPEGTRSASLQVVDQNGRIIKIIPIQATGKGQLTLQANLLSAGTYSYSLVLDGQVMETKQMVLTH